MLQTEWDLSRWLTWGYASSLHQEEKPNYNSGGFVSKSHTLSYPYKYLRN